MFFLARTVELERWTRYTKHISKIWFEDISFSSFDVIFESHFRKSFSISIPFHFILYSFHFHFHFHFVFIFIFIFIFLFIFILFSTSFFRSLYFWLHSISANLKKFAFPISSELSFCIFVNFHFLKITKIFSSRKWLIFSGAFSMFLDGRNFFLAWR